MDIHRTAMVLSLLVGAIFLVIHVILVVSGRGGLILRWLI